MSGAGARANDDAASRAELLGRSPLFGVLTPEERAELTDLFVEVSYHTGDTVCREGEEGDTLFVIASGELEVWGGPAGRQVINRLGPGDVVGEMALISGTARAATVTASRPSRLLALNKAAFERFLLPNPKVLEHLSRMLCRRLATLARGEVASRSTTAVAVVGSPRLKGKSLVAAALAGFLAEQAGREAVLVRAGRREDGRRRADAPALSEVWRDTAAPLSQVLEQLAPRVACLPVAAAGGEDRSALVHDLTMLTTKLGERFPFVVFDLGLESAPVQGAARDFADVVIEVVDVAVPSAPPANGSARRVLQVVNLHNQNSRPIPLNHCEPFVIPHEPGLTGLDPAAQVRFLAEHRWSPAARVVQRLARKILRASVGLALGGGAAFGIAHIGVLKVLDDNDVPIDLLVGCSMGSIVAMGYAAGIRPHEMIAISERIGTKWMTLSALLDVSLTRPGLLSGDRVAQIFVPLAGDVKDFTQLHLPCRTVAADIETGERIAIGSGSLETAFRASSAVPMLWPPIRVDGRALVDGGVVDPVPAEVVTAMGADLCIAVNAVPPLKKGVDTVLSRLYRRLNAVNPFAYLGQSRGLPSMFDLIMNSMQTLQYELGNFKAISADVRINPDLSAHTWIEFYRSQELIARGAEAAERALPEIKRVLGQRLAAGAGG